MRYLTRTSIIELKAKYKHIIGWGAGGAFRKTPQARLFMDYIVDTGEKGSQWIGKMLWGVRVCSPEDVKELVKSDTVLFVIFPNIENLILDSLRQTFTGDVDFIVGRLVDWGETVRNLWGGNSYSTDYEDRIILDLMKKLDYDTNVPYMDIGVCHPVVANNTFLLYENGFFHGVLVEPNPSMAALAKVYREKNRILSYGVTAKQGKDLWLTYYSSELRPGLNTFLEEKAIERGLLKNQSRVAVKNINELIEEHFQSEYPKLIDIDTEGMDYELLEALDTYRYQPDIICAEANTKQFYKMMENKGYKIYAVTLENTIFIKAGIL